ncbi:hypothetical protein BH23ACT3_BH23ACT3_14270 [soil metagenome]
MAESLHLVAAILAHQGGWDEILLVLTPIVVIALMLRLVKRRVDATAAPDSPVDDTTVDDTTVDDDVTRR